MGTLKVSDVEFKQLRDYIESQCGISITEEKKYLIESRLTRLVVENGVTTFGEFIRKVVGSRDPKLRERIVDAMTTNETLWFRDTSPWQALRQSILPEFAKQAATIPSKRFRIWSAACSTGQEPYTIAMSIDDFSTAPNGHILSPSQVEIVATDISPSALFIAMSGRYDKISMNRGFEGEWARFRDKYFETKGRASAISPSIKSRVKFQKFNLQDDFSSLGKFDLIFLRNVAIYFSETFKKNLFEKLARSLNPRGQLILGSAESLAGYSTRFKGESTGRAIVYRLSA